MRRSAFLAAVGASAATSAIGAGSARAATLGTPPDAPAAAAEILDEFLHGWNGYKRAAWGHDEVLPVSGAAREFFVPTHSFGLSMIEALDTLYVMGLDDELALAVDWLKKNLSFDVDGEVEVFESTIRMVGGLLAGYYATGERFMVDAARDLADRSLPVFAKSPTGVPYRFVNLRTGAVREAVTNIAESGSNILEFGDLSRLTGDPKYVQASKRSYAAVIAKRSPIDLLAAYFDVEKGTWQDPIDVAPNDPADSFYEYLWGGWKMLGDTDCRDWYRMLTDAMLKYQLERYGGNLWFKQVDYATGATTGRKQSELAAFYAELLAQGGDVSTGVAYYDSWTTVAQRYGLIPEEIEYTTLAATSVGYELRPEYANSAFDLWLMTGDEKYRSTGYAHFLQMKKNCRVDGGYTVLKDVTKSPMVKGDLTPAYWFAENMKYLYLMFASAPRFDYRNNYLSTEGKILRGLLRP